MSHWLPHKRVVSTSTRDQSSIVFSLSRICSPCGRTYRNNITTRPPQRQSHAFVLTYLLTTQKSRQKPHANAIEHSTRKYLRERIEALSLPMRKSWDERGWRGWWVHASAPMCTPVCQGIGIGIVMHRQHRTARGDRYCFANIIILHWLYE